MKSIPIFLVFLLLISCNQEAIDLSGDWDFKMDKSDVGETEQWYSSTFDGNIVLPGSMASNGLGEDISMETEWTGGIRNPDWATDPNYVPYHDENNVRLPYWLQPDKKYTGAAWYQKEINIPIGWNSNQLKIYFERVHWESTLWFDDQLIGMENSLGTSHEYIIDNASSGKHLITVRVDNRTKEVDVGWDSHSISDHTQSNWNGIAGDLRISPLASIRFSPITITSNIVTKTIIVTGEILNNEKVGLKAYIEGKVVGNEVDVAVAVEVDVEKREILLKPGKNSFDFELALGDDALLWDEFDPSLYTLELSVKAGKDKDEIVETFGLRNIEANENGIFVNGRHTFLRGTLECAIFPLTGYPSTDPEEWKRIMLIIKDHGLNHMRFHSWCPPEAAFIAADEVGVYLQVECSSWANSTTSIGNGYPIDQYIIDESKLIIEKYGNHPSFVMMAYGNEPAGQFQNKYLTDFVTYWKDNDPRRLYTSAGGWPKLPVNDYHNAPQPRIQGWGEQLNSIINANPPSSSYDWSSRIDNLIPTVSHEIGQWCVYPNLKETVKYTGVLKARNFEVFKESLEAHKMGHLADSFLLASGKLQALCYKADIEAALRTPNFGGFQLLDLHDFPGQGTALVGVLDPFWEEKGYITPEEFRQFCNTTVPLARLDKHIFVEGETMKVPIQIALFEKTDIIPSKANVSPAKAGTIIRLMTKDGQVISQESIKEQNIPIGNNNFIGDFVYTFEKTGQPRQLQLEVSLGEFTNKWNIWVYPESINESTQSLSGGSPERSFGVEGPLLISTITPKILKDLENGASLLLSLGQGKVSKEFGGEVGVGFSSIFWNTAWTGGQKPHTLGILCNPKHPALKDFPTDYYSDWQWWDAMAHADAIQLDNLPEGLNPIVRIIDDWVSNRQLGLVIEAKVGKGKIIISGADLHTNIENRPAAKQLRSSLLSYMATKNFNPKEILPPATIMNLEIE